VATRAVLGRTHRKCETAFVDASAGHARPNESLPKQSNTVFLCQNWADESRKWLGKCPECGEWNSLVEERVVNTKKGGSRDGFRLREAKAVAYDEIESQDDTRVSSGVTEFDRVLAAELCRARWFCWARSRIGKSTLLLQVAEKLSENGATVLYVSGEESERQNKTSRRTFGSEAANLLLLPETNLENIQREIDD
jgi:DNA repair protein RadA/Sms